jgi:hypothetical protein
MRRDPSEGPRRPMSVCHGKFGVDNVRVFWNIFSISANDLVMLT